MEARSTVFESGGGGGVVHASAEYTVLQTSIYSRRHNYRKVLTLNKKIPKQKNKKKEKKTKQGL